MNAKPFTVTSFAWRKDVEDRLAAAGEESDSDEVVLANLSALAAFLQANGLTTRQLTNSQNFVERDFVLRSDDLTELGLRLIRKGYEKWRRESKSPTDVRSLERALASL